MHRVHDEDVLICGWSRHSDQHYSVDADWSRPHCFFRTLASAADHTMLVEQTIRQGVLGLLHVESGVPPTDHFLMNRLTYRLDPLNLPDTDARVTLDVVFTRRNRRAVDVALTLWHAGGIFGTADAGLGWIAPQVYARLRGDRRPVSPAPTSIPVSPLAVGRHSDDETLLAPLGDGKRWELRPNPGHPALIDHAVDHVPGLVLMEAARQAAFAGTLQPGYAFTAAALRPYQYVEFDAPCWLEASEIPALTPFAAAAEVTGTQDGEVVFRCHMEASQSVGSGAHPLAGLAAQA
ncbi:hypothetical protein G5C51_16640 [Streptomyces sp. A7024]|uniref:A-factor biosynthesis hotdog domain-containing protein n=1 Tax=Streptomyces coryli TaxID=1128680 RepID=A0A6G4U2B9_9ACTN|nr:hypothetical protein [Streptomyces coryli]